MKPLITVDSICMDFDGKRVLDNISFTIGEGEVLGIIGRSGAGKTVLMHLIRGVEQPPTSGKIIYHVSACDTCEYVGVGSASGFPCPKCGGTMKALDIDLWDEKNSAMKRRVMRSTAIIFQRTFALYGNDRAIENVLHALDDIDFPQDRAINRAANLLDQVRLSHSMMHIARDLSGGEKQRVVLARQLAKEPFLLFADIYSTHLHELAGRVEEMNGSVDGDSKIISVVSSPVDVSRQADGSETHRRYKLEIRPPLGQSYAREIAARYGISYQQLEDVLSKRGVL